MAVRKPTWATWSFVLYAGGFIVLFGSAAALAFLASEFGDAAFVAWTLIPLLVLSVIALAFRGWGEWTAAGLFVVAALVVWTVFLGALFEWWGWLPDEEGSPFDGWHWAVWLLMLIVIATAIVDLRLFGFPLLVLFPAVFAWFIVVDVLSGGGGWSAVLTLVVGLVYLAIALQLDGGPQRPYGFWVHLVAGLLVGGALLYWWNSSDADWALVATTGIVFVGIARATRRSSWAVLGVIGLSAAATNWVLEWTQVTPFPFFGPAEAPMRGWVPGLVYGILGLFLVLLGLWARGRPDDAAP